MKSSKVEAAKSCVCSGCQSDLTDMAGTADTASTTGTNRAMYLVERPFFMVTRGNYMQQEITGEHWKGPDSALVHVERDPIVIEDLNELCCWEDSCVRKIGIEVSDIKIGNFVMDLNLDFYVIIGNVNKGKVPVKDIVGNKFKLDPKLILPSLKKDFVDSLFTTYNYVKALTGDEWRKVGLGCFPVVHYRNMDSTAIKKLKFFPGYREYYYEMVGINL